MSQISEAIEARQAQIVQLQSDIEILRSAASIMGGGDEAPAKAPAKAKPQPKVKQKAKTKKPRAQPTSSTLAVASPSWMRADMASPIGDKVEKSAFHS